MVARDVRERLRRKVGDNGFSEAVPVDDGDAGEKLSLQATVELEGVPLGSSDLGIGDCVQSTDAK